MNGLDATVTKSVLAAIAGLATCGSLFAFPSQAEIDKAKSIVGALVANDIRAANADKAKREEVGDKIHGFVGDAETEAAKWLLLKHAFIQYAKCGNYDKAADMVSEILAVFPDVPPVTAHALIVNNAGRAKPNHAAGLLRYRDFFVMRQKCNACFRIPSLHG